MILDVAQMDLFGSLELKKKQVDSLFILEDSELFLHGRESTELVLILMLMVQVLLGLSINHNIFSNIMVRSGSDGLEEPTM